MALTSPAAPSRYFPLAEIFELPFPNWEYWYAPPSVDKEEILVSDPTTTNPSPCIPAIVVMYRPFAQCKK